MTSDALGGTADDGTIESVLAFYRDEIARARVITDSATLEELSRARSPHYGIDGHTGD